jgi:hypothetical protein
MSDASLDNAIKGKELCINKTVAIDTEIGRLEHQIKVLQTQKRLHIIMANNYEKRIRALCAGCGGGLSQDKIGCHNCGNLTYCGNACRVRHWPMHRVDCPTL